MDAIGEVFLTALSETEVGTLREHGVVRTYPRGTALFHEQQAPDRVVLLLAGCVKLSALSEDGKEVVFAIRGPGDPMQRTDGRARLTPALRTGCPERAPVGRGHRASALVGEGVRKDPENRSNDRRSGGIRVHR